MIKKILSLLFNMFKKHQYLVSFEFNSVYGNVDFFVKLDGFIIYSKTLGGNFIKTFEGYTIEYGNEKIRIFYENRVIYDGHIALKSPTFVEELTFTGGKLEKNDKSKRRY